MATLLGLTSGSPPRRLSAGVRRAALVGSTVSAAILAVAGVRAALLALAVLVTVALAKWGCRTPRPIAGVTAGAIVVSAALITSDPIASVAAVGVGAAAGVDLAERRIPTIIAHGTTVLCVLAVVGRSIASGTSLITPWVSAGVVVAIYACLWLVGGVGFGDVRLAAATVSGAEAGLRYVAAMITVPLLVLPIVAIAWWLARRRPPVPFAPAMVAGWLVALTGLNS